MATNGLLNFNGTNKATFVGANSNIVLDTVNSSLGIGITGTDAPSSNLYITGNAYVSSDLTVSTNTLHVDTTNSRVGVGTVSPQAPLHIGDYTSGSAGELLRLSGASSSDRHFKFLNEDDGVIGGAGANAIWVHDINSSFGQYAFRTNNTELMRITNSGNVGIGTTSPGASLEVHGPDLTGEAVGTTSLISRHVSGLDGVLNIFGVVAGSSGEETLGLQTQIDGRAWQSDIDGGWSTGSDSRYNLLLQPYKGNVGIGTTTPTAQLHISSGNSGDCVLKIEADEDNNDETDNPRIEFITDGGYNTALVGAGQMPFETSNDNALVLAAFQMKFYTGSVQDFTDSTTMTERMRILSNGNVGIGTSSPEAQLHIGPKDNDHIYLASSNNDYGWKIDTDDQGAGEVPFRIIKRLNDVDTTVLTIKNQDGNVGIGKTDPDAKLHVNGNAIIGDKGGYATNGYTDAQLTLGGTHNTNLYNQDDQIKLLISGGNNDAGSPYYIMCEDENGNDQFYVKGGNTSSGSNGVTYVRGVVGIKQTAPSYTLDVNGTIRYTSSGSSASDDRIKYNEEDISAPLALISQLKPQKYEKIMEFPNPSEGTWIPTDEEWETAKDEYKYGDEFGLIAQDIHNIPELKFLVSGEETKMEMKTVSLEEYSNLTTEERSTYTTPVYMYISTEDTISMERYSNLTSEVQQTYTQSISGYTKEIETQTPLSLNYNGLFVVAIGAIQELKAENDAIKARLYALENA